MGGAYLLLPQEGLEVETPLLGAGEHHHGKSGGNIVGQVGGDWERQKSRAKKAVQDLAKGLIQLYAQRQRQPGFAFSPDSPWQKEFEEEFEYTETEDQLRCIAGGCR